MKLYDVVPDPSWQPVGNEEQPEPEPDCSRHVKYDEVTGTLAAVLIMVVLAVFAFRRERERERA